MADKSFLVQNEEGHIATVIARSDRAAAKKYAHENRLPRGYQLRVKQRGVGGWSDWRVS